mmetsp:Transcript_6845/g.12780  ORF Transcript_6845/g.12780 Transcript_6845/m.12780 type:complete len:92 (+) Transcript_6845:452-727(+)
MLPTALKCALAQPAALCFTPRHIGTQHLRVRRGSCQMRCPSGERNNEGCAMQRWPGMQDQPVHHARDGALGGACQDELCAAPFVKLTNDTV